MKKYLIFDLDWTLIESHNNLTKIIKNYIYKNFPPEKIDEEAINYYFENSRWTGLAVQLEKILKISKIEAAKHAKNIYDEININWEKWKFFPWVINKIEELSKNYKLFLSTWNSTKFAEENLKKWKIYNYFEYILWSENISKSSEHIKIFKEISLDNNFEKKAIFIWDWEKDREIAKENFIDFIHIDSELSDNFWDKYEIKSVAEISNILNSNFL